jgi:hypothetical protein
MNILVYFDKKSYLQWHLTKERMYRSRTNEFKRLWFMSESWLVNHLPSQLSFSDLFSTTGIVFPHVLGLAAYEVEVKLRNYSPCPVKILKIVSITDSHKILIYII